MENTNANTNDTWLVWCDRPDTATEIFVSKSRMDAASPMIRDMAHLLLDGLLQRFPHLAVKEVE